MAELGLDLSPWRASRKLERLSIVPGLETRLKGGKSKENKKGDMSKVMGDRKDNRESWKKTL